MDRNIQSDYDDMSVKNLRKGSEYDDRKHLIMKRLVTFIIILCVAASLVGIVYIFRMPSKDPAQPGTVGAADGFTLPENTLLDDAVKEILQEALDENLTPEQRSAADRAQSGNPLLGTSQVASPASSTQQTSGTPAQVAETPSSEGSQEDASSPQDDTSSPVSSNEVSEEDARTVSEAAQPAGTQGRENKTIDTSRVTFVEHIVKPGDTITGIARSYGVKPETIIGVNTIRDYNSIEAGTILKIPNRDGQMYIVKSGDSLSVIASGFGMGYLTLAEVNGLTSSLIRPGDALFIPDRTISEEVFKTVMKTLFIRPAEGSISVAFNDELEDITTGEIYESDGIQIVNSTGTPVLAAMSGTIKSVTSDTSGLGKYIIMSHENGYTTLYAHLDKALVHVGDFVEQGSTIGSLGNTGKILSPALYFEIRKDGVPIDPADYF